MGLVVTLSEDRTRIRAVHNGKPGEELPVIEVWESITGWYWFGCLVPYKDDPDILFGFVRGFDCEWGDFSRSELKSLGPCKAWKIAKKNWSALPLGFHSSGASVYDIEAVEA